jgi:ribosomal protein S18 acetylase RimI-like enzyme
MRAREVGLEDRAEAMDLWERSGLSRPWNPPENDFARAVNGSTSAVLGLYDGDDIVGTVMVGDDGHRGWVYYLAVDPGRRGQGLAREAMRSAERWLAARGVRKVELMVRESNHGVADFYDAVGYQREEVLVFSRWLVERHG